MGKIKTQQNDQSSVYQRCLTLIYYLLKKKKNKKTEQETIKKTLT